MPKKVVEVVVVPEKVAFNSTAAVARAEAEFEAFAMEEGIDLDTLRRFRALAKRLISTAETQLIGDREFMKILKYRWEI